MVLSRNSKLVKYAYMNQVPYLFESIKTSLCAMFWRCVITTLLYSLFAALVIVLLTLLGIAIYKNPHKTVVILAVLAGDSAFLTFLYFVSDPVKSKWDAIADSPTGQMIRSVKGKVCPLVEIK